MLAEMVKAVIKKTLATDYPHVRLPAVALAKIDSARELDSYEIENLTFYNDDEGKSCQGHMEASWYEYKLTIDDRELLLQELNKIKPARTLLSLRKEQRYHSRLYVGSAYIIGKQITIRQG